MPHAPRRSVHATLPVLLLVHTDTVNVMLMTHSHTQAGSCLWWEQMCHHTYTRIWSHIEHTQTHRLSRACGGSRWATAHMSIWSHVEHTRTHRMSRACGGTRCATTRICICSHVEHTNTHRMSRACGGGRIDTSPHIYAYDHMSNHLSRCLSHRTPAVSMCCVHVSIYKPPHAHSVCPSPHHRDIFS